MNDEQLVKGERFNIREISIGRLFRAVGIEIKSLMMVLEDTNHDVQE